MEHYKLNNRNVSNISERVSTPQYNRENIKTGIVHVGVGGFHRAHQAMYLDQLLHDASNSNWGICGVALLHFDQKIYNTLKDQDGLYTLVVKELDGTLTKRVIGSITEYLYAPDSPKAVIEKMASPDVKIITLTITEGGYNLNEATGAFNLDNPQIIHDSKNAAAPVTIFGYLTQALKLRKETNSGPITILSCDNIEGNGDVAKKMLLSYVQFAEPELLDWINANVSFPNSMVDRITPATVPSDISHLAETSGIEDQWPVVCESFQQWVVEDNFIAGRPNLESVGVQFVTDVEPFEKMKLGLLNAGHSVIGILGGLMGYSTIDEAISNPAIATFLSIYLDNEVTPILHGLDGMDLPKYKKTLIERFSNIYIKDQIDRICSESSAKIPKFILPTVYEQLKSTGTINYAAFVIAAWAIYSLGLNEKNEAINIKDAQQDVLFEQALLAKNNPEVFLAQEAVFGNLSKSAVFCEAFTKAYKDIIAFGVEKCIVEMNSNFLIKK
ncbi:mannitol dehydrogenase family protein [Flavobacterium sp. NG2]|uniref:mannitol dehydrogenase family protein n=1 Tax=Flavobacterium sp. NG2 TaxID=3097547 RepID=UPI002A805908|nr:mannitol dehydrogenase family protein [Flavobacterium sp. NG2]WPR72363.1 mannitol dehydrogenase family protein [Flavobacterium sp. NG2]